jgi:hypothetical protein
VRGSDPVAARADLGLVFFAAVLPPPPTRARAPGQGQVARRARPPRPRRDDRRRLRRGHRPRPGRHRTWVVLVDGACRHIIADRLGIGGARWGLDGAEAVLTLRAVISKGDFNEYWDFHLAQEHQRLYPGTIQGQYTLCA